MMYNVGDRYRCIASPYNWGCVGEIFTMTNTETKCLTTIPPQYSTSIHMYCAATKQEWVLGEEDFDKYFEPEEALIKPEAIVLPTKENKGMDKIKRHKELCEELNKIYAQKNEKYGDSFGISVQKYGLIAALTRMSDKFNRLEQLILTRSDGTADESLMDTLLDLSNYTIMTVIELENRAVIEEMICEGTDID